MGSALAENRGRSTFPGRYCVRARSEAGPEAGPATPEAGVLPQLRFSGGRFVLLLCSFSCNVGVPD